MLETLVLLVIIASVVLFFRAGRRNTIAYRRKVDHSDRGYSIRDHPCAFDSSHDTSSRSAFCDTTDRDTSVYERDTSVHERNDHASNDFEGFQFGGGDFGGGGAGESYGSDVSDNSFETTGSESSSTDCSSESSSSDDSPTGDSSTVSCD
ncbi:hypothetical protein [Dyadobacter beijingensis]|uniref:hypothetical protein n=1 Tax=Dyadobacter beijingensis TaxID=365489 RepID=UPI00038084E3|nr:hypothetical protein [Dyadobacter beijingensis]